MKVWEFKDNQNFKWLVTEDKGNLKMEVMTFSTLTDNWNLIDQMQKDGKLKFIKEYEMK